MSPRLCLPLLALAGCAITADQQARDQVAPTLVVETPERGTLTDERRVLVTGRASDDSGERIRLTIGDELVNMLSSGRFEHSIELEPGLHMIDVSASDAAGNLTTDTRAIFVGELGSGHDGVDDAVALFVGQSQLAIVGTVISSELAALDLGDLVAAGNPVFKTGGGCVRASVDVQGIDVGSIVIEPTAQKGSLRLVATLEDVHVDLLADYRLACLGGKQSIDVDADRIIATGNLKLAIRDGLVVATLEDAEVVAEGLDADIGLAGLEQIVNAIDSIVFDRLSDRLVEALAGSVQKVVGDAINRPYTITLDGFDLHYRVEPTEIVAHEEGLAIKAKARAWIDGISGVPFVATDENLPTLPTGGLAMAVTDDAVTHLVAVLWAAGFFDRSFDISSLGILPGVDRVELELLLPPAVVVEGDRVQVVIADALVSLFPEGGGQRLLQLAATTTVEVELGVGEDGSLLVELDAGEPTVLVVDEQPGASDAAFVATVPALTAAALELILSDLDRDLDGLQFPRFAGLEVAFESVATGHGSALLLGALVSSAN